MASVQETKELIAALAVVKKSIEKELADGFQWQEDVPAVLETLAESEAVKVAFEGIENILPELKDASLFDKISLVISLVRELL
jgi:riboflavin biosynthesis pyrimidine reductase